MEIYTDIPQLFKMDGVVLCTLLNIFSVYSSLHVATPLKSRIHFTVFFCLLSKYFFKFLFSVSVIAAVTHETDGTVSSDWYTDRKFTIVVTAVLVILPLSIPKEIGFQKYARYKHSSHSAYFYYQRLKQIFALCDNVSKMFCIAVR